MAMLDSQRGPKLKKTKAKRPSSTQLYSWAERRTFRARTSWDSHAGWSRLQSGTGRQHLWFQSNLERHGLRFSRIFQDVTAMHTVDRSRLCASRCGSCFIFYTAFVTWSSYFYPPWLIVIKSCQKEITLPSKRSPLCHNCDEVVIIYWFPCGKDFKESAPYSRKTPSTVGMKVGHKSSDQPCHQLQTTSPFRVLHTADPWAMFEYKNPTFNRGSKVARGVISTPGHWKYCKCAKHCPAVYFPLILVRIPYLKVIHFWNDSLYFEPSLGPLGSWLAPQPKIGHGFGEWPLWRIPKLSRFSAFLWAYTCLLLNHLI